MTNVNEAIRTFMQSSFGGNGAALNDFLHKNNYYQQLVYTALAHGVTTDRLNFLGRQLSSLARVACLTRRPDEVEKIDQLMRVLPLPKSVQALTHYYEGLRLGRYGEFDAAERLLNKAAEDVAPEFKPRVFLELGNCHYDRGDVSAAGEALVIAGKLGRERDPITFLQSQQCLAYIYGSNGDSSWAVKTFESIFPSLLVTARSFPIIYYLSLNNFAVYLGDVGRVDEAQAALSIALGSRYAPAFPEWARTRAELETKRRHPRPSFVSLSSSTKPARQERSKPKKHPTHDRTKAVIIRRALALSIIAGLPLKSRRALHWLAGLSIFTSALSAPILAKPISVDVEALHPITSDWPTSGPGPRAPPSFL